MLAITGVALLASCRTAARAFGTSAALAAAHADQLFGAFDARFTGTVRSPKYEVARVRLARAALVPSRIYDDTAVWTAMPATSVRTLVVGGRLDDGRYRLEAAPVVPIPARLGDSRHVVGLTRLGSDQFIWDTNIDFGVGALTMPEADAVTEALLSAGGARSERELRADYRSAFPRSAAALGRVFGIDSVRLSPATDGSVDVALVIGIRPEGLRATLPSYARTLEKYTAPTRLSLALAERGGGPAWFLVEGRGRDLALRFRSLRGRLVPLTGPTRPLPDTLELRADLTTRLRMFTIGFRNLATDFVLTRTPHERAWSIVARREPDWQLPLVTERLLRSPLHRPFEGIGAIFSLSLRDSVGPQTIVSRRSHLAVQESPILRFLGGLGSHAVNDFAGESEREEEQFLREVFGALRADVRGLGNTNAASP